MFPCSCSINISVSLSEAKSEASISPMTLPIICGDRCANSSCVCVWLSDKPLRLADKRDNCQWLSYAVCFYAAGLCDTCSRYLNTAQGRCGYAAGRGYEQSDKQGDRQAV